MNTTETTKKFNQHYAIVTPDGGYWHGDGETTTLSQNANPTDFGHKKEAEEEMALAIDYCKKNGFYTDVLDYKVTDFGLETYGNEEDWDGVSSWGL